VDFACPQKMLVVEDDLKRQEHLETLGWKVIRFSDKEVEEDAEAIAQTIARELNLSYKIKPRTATGSGMKNINAPKKRRR
jgi:leucyl-tRNA synthetase